MQTLILNNYLNMRKFLIFISTSLLFSCSQRIVKNKDLSINSDIRYKDVAKVSISPYKSVQERKGQNSNLSVGLSVAGGGSRAQYLGTGVLIGLDEISNGERSFLNEIDYFSTVSGGGFGVGYYLILKRYDILSSYNNYLDFWKSNNHKINYQENIFKNAEATNIFTKFRRYEKNSIKTTYPTLINKELLQLNRAYGDTNTTKPVNSPRIKELTLKSFFIPKDSLNLEVKLPMFVANGAIYNNGDRFPFMPHIIADLNIYRSLLPPRTFFINNDQSKSIVSYSGYDMTLQYPICGSAAFPGVLPMLKFAVKTKKDSVIRVIDGGVNDNLGANTLFELLMADSVKRKIAISVNCSGTGLESYYVSDKKLGRFDFITKAALYAVSVNQSLSAKTNASKFSNSGITYLEIGFLTLKNKLQSDYINLDIDSKNKIDDLKAKIKSKIIRSYELNDILLNGINDKCKLNLTKENLSEINTNLFSKFTYSEVFAIFELASQVETKISIGDWEKQVLVLAGRYAVYLEKDNISKMLSSK